MNQFKVGDVVQVNNPLRREHGRVGLVENVSPSGEWMDVRFSNAADDWGLFRSGVLKIATVYVPLSEAVSAVEVQRAYERDHTPAPQRRCVGSADAHATGDAGPQGTHDNGNGRPATAVFGTGGVESEGR